MDFFYEDTRTSVRFRDARGDLDSIPSLFLKRIGEDGKPVKPKVDLPITNEKIRSAESLLKSDTNKGLEEDK